MVHTIVTLLPLAVCAFWSVAMALSLWEKGNHAARRPLLLWAVTATLLYAGHFVFFNRMTSYIPLTDTIYVVCNLLVYPLYLYYITMLTTGKVSTTQRWLTVVPPSVVGIVVATIYIIMCEDDSQRFINTYLYNGTMEGLPPLGKVQAVAHQTAKALFAIGLVAVLCIGIRRIRRYNTLIDSIYADNDDKRLYGITTILLLMVLTGVLSFVVNAIGRFVFLSSEIPFALLACFFSTLLYMLCYRGFVQRFAFEDIEREECEDTVGEAPQADYPHLLQTIDDERLYLQPGLTLAGLAQQLGTNRTMLSKLVNEETGMPFAEFINRKRIAYVVMLERQNPGIRKEDLAQQAGYTSMRSFYRNYNLYR